ncbi:nucleotidyltransferase family protein [Candidatus Sumerlaeota bacterium]|nr:nucleotidyltransferase family protein [Candidatus Sumerlaeota bacterium]
MVSAKQDILDTILRNRHRLSELGIARIGLFGSFVRGEQRPDSDVDLLVEFEPGRKTFDSFMAVCFFLEDLLGRRVELVTPESLSPYLAPYILKEVEYAPLAA